MKIWDALRVRLFGVPTPKGDMPRTIGGCAQNAWENRSQIRNGNEGGAELQTPDRFGTAGDEKAFEDDISTRAHPKKSVETVLFICSGNICRSAYGAARLLKMAQDSGRALRVSSCGTLRIIGRGAAVGMIEAAEARGIDLSSHRSSAITTAILRASDVIFAMAPEHHQEVMRLAPECKPRVILLGNFLRMPKIQIDDPMGKTAADYARAAAEIDEALQNWWDKSGLQCAE